MSQNVWTSFPAHLIIIIIYFIALRYVCLDGHWMDGCRSNHCPIYDSAHIDEIECFKWIFSLADSKQCIDLTVIAGDRRPFVFRPKTNKK